MFQDNPLLAQLKQQIRENIPKKEGVIRASDRGFGFLEVDEKTSYFVPPPYMKKVMHGDRVSALIVPRKRRKWPAGCPAGAGRGPLRRPRQDVPRPPQRGA